MKEKHADVVLNSRNLRLLDVQTLVWYNNCFKLQMGFKMFWMIVHSMPLAEAFPESSGNSSGNRYWRVDSLHSWVQSSWPDRCICFWSRSEQRHSWSLLLLLQWKRPYWRYRGSFSSKHGTARGCDSQKAWFSPEYRSTWCIWMVSHLTQRSWNMAPFTRIWNLI